MSLFRLGGIVLLLAATLLLAALGHTSLERAGRLAGHRAASNEFTAELARTVSSGFVDAAPPRRVHHRFTGRAAKRHDGF